MQETEKRITRVISSSRQKWMGYNIQVERLALNKGMGSLLSVARRQAEVHGDSHK